MGLCPSTIAEAGALIDRGAMSAIDLLEETFRRIAELNPRLGAFCTLDADRASELAAETDRRIAAGGRRSRLDGIPLHVKDNIFVADVPCGWGSLLYRDFVPKEDDLPVARLREAGAVLIGKTNTPELALSGTTDNRVFGPSRNPYDLSRTPGGSSGGGVAATAARLGFGGLCTDAGGSIRRPAGYAGVFGLKTAIGSVERTVGFPPTVNDFQTVGPIAATLDDLEAIFAAIRTSRPAPPPDERSRVRVSVIVDVDHCPVEPSVAGAIAAAADALRDAGYAVSERPAPWHRADVETAFGILSAAGAARIRSMHPEHDWSERATPAIQSLARRGQELTAVDHVKALDTVAALRLLARDWFGGTTLWLMPTSPCTAWPLHDDHPASIGGRPAGPRDAAIYGPVVNALGAAGLALPAGLDGNGLPIGLQLVAGPGQEDLAIAAARDLVEVIGPLPPPAVAGAA